MNLSSCIFVLDFCCVVAYGGSIYTCSEVKIVIVHCDGPVPTSILVSTNICFNTCSIVVGVHDEGSLFRALYGIFFWDVIYCDAVPNVFRSKFQAAPLDLACSSFFTSREAVIKSKLKAISESAIEALLDLAKVTWDSHKDKYTALINWDRFRSFEHLAGFVSCFSPKQLERLMERYAMDYGAVRSGFPDLTVWNPESRKLKVVEVKGPNDRLSHKQQIWLDFLMDIGVDVEVCHVVATGAKKLKRSLSANSTEE